MRAELSEGHGALERADLTVWAPAPASVAAALGLGDRVPVAGADLTHILQHLREAVAFPIVCKGRHGKERFRALRERNRV